MASAASASSADALPLIILDIAERMSYHACRNFIVVFGIMAFLSLLYIPAPFGKFASAAWGFQLPGKLAWSLMELVPLLAFVRAFLNGHESSLLAVVADKDIPVLSWLYFAAFVGHYFQRSIVYTYLAPSIKPISWIVFLSAVVFNTCNGYINGIAASSPTFSSQTPSSTTLVGLILFLAGMIINIKSDQTLFKLRHQSIQKSESSPSPSSSSSSKPHEKSHYVIPRGHIYTYISCGNYFGEMVEWAGWAVLTGSEAGLLFFAFTCANLVPRALAAHRWYRNVFGDAYPRERKALIPFLL